MIRSLPPNATIGLVGGGQLGRMSALAAARLGYRCHILTREKDSPASQVSMATTISDYHEPDGLRRFAAALDVISLEFENVSAEGLDLLIAQAGAAFARIPSARIASGTFLNQDIATPLDADRGP
jgi:5-(carboxyamino)imidazole ribonucleotide synthase